VSEILNQFRDEELPVSTVDVSRAMRAGRRGRVGRGLAIGGAVVAVVAAGTTASVLLSPQPTSSPPPFAPPPAPTCDAAEAPPQSPSPTWEYFDPLTMEIDASRVEGYRVAVTATSTYWQIAQLEGDTTVGIMLYARGGEPYSFVDEAVRIDPAAGEPADPVNGAPAYWLAPTDPLAIAWQWTPGAWAMVFARPPEPGQSASPLSEDDLRAIAIQVAGQLEFGAGTPVTSPFALPIPACTYPAHTVQFRARDNGREFPVSFYLGFDRLGTTPPTHVGGYVPFLWVDANAFATVNDLPDGATPYTEEDLGYPAYHSDQRQAEGRDSDILLVYDVFGFGMEIEPRLMPGTAEERLAYAADIFRTITVYPDAATELSAWGDAITP
jgi:hypothetical protein